MNRYISCLDPANDSEEVIADSVNDDFTEFSDSECESEEKADATHDGTSGSQLLHFHSSSGIISFQRCTHLIAVSVGCLRMLNWMKIVVNYTTFSHIWTRNYWKPL